MSFCYRVRQCCCVQQPRSCPCGVLGAVMPNVPLTNGGFAIVDPDDLDRVSARRWYWKEGPYVVTTLQRRVSTSLHRFVLGMERGDSRHVDHVNGNGLDNRKCNLRVCSPSQNQHNKRKQKNNKSGIKGLSWHKKTGKWRADVTINYKRVSIGVFACKLEATIALAKAREILHGEFARHE